MAPQSIGRVTQGQIGGSHFFWSDLIVLSLYQRLGGLSVRQYWEAIADRNEATKVLSE